MHCYVTEHRNHAATACPHRLVNTVEIPKKAMSKILFTSPARSGHMEPQPGFSSGQTATSLIACMTLCYTSDHF